jgi:hypothetical protein
MLIAIAVITAVMCKRTATKIASAESARAKERAGLKLGGGAVVSPASQASSGGGVEPASADDASAAAPSPLAARASAAGAALASTSPRGPASLFAPAQGGLLSRLRVADVPKPSDAATPAAADGTVDDAPRTPDVSLSVSVATLGRLPTVDAVSASPLPGAVPPTLVSLSGDASGERSLAVSQPSTVSSTAAVSGGAAMDLRSQRRVLPPLRRVPAGDAHASTAGTGAVGALPVVVVSEDHAPSPPALVAVVEDAAPLDGDVSVAAPPLTGRATDPSTVPERAGGGGGAVVAGGPADGAATTADDEDPSASLLRGCDANGDLGQVPHPTTAAHASGGAIAASPVHPPSAGGEGSAAVPTSTDTGSADAVERLFDAAAREGGASPM